MTPDPVSPKRGFPKFVKHALHKIAHRRHRRGLTDEEIADEYARRLHSRGILVTITSLIVLTIAAAVVLVPFAYMLLISLKGPAQVGNGNLFPEELIAYFRQDASWIQVQLGERQVVALNNLKAVPVLPAGSAPFAPWPEPKPLPQGVMFATTVSLERQSPVSPFVSALLELRGYHSPASSKNEPVIIYLPSDKPELWLPVEGNIVPRTFATVTARMLSNYRNLVYWDDLKQGNILAWVSKGYPRWYINSLFVAFVTVTIGLFFDSLAAFAFAKFQFPFKKALFALLVGTLMIPYPVTLVPTFFIFAKLDFYNTYAALIVPGIVSAFGIFLVRQYMEGIPDDMLHAARVDGASDFQLYRTIMLPTARPVLAALAVFRFIYQWNTYLYPLVLTNKDTMKTVQLGIATMEDVHGMVDYGMQMAGSTLAVVPILLVYMFMQKHFIAGITMGSAKG